MATRRRILQSRPRALIVNRHEASQARDSGRRGPAQESGLSAHGDGPQSATVAANAAQAPAQAVPPLVPPLDPPLDPSGGTTRSYMSQDERNAQLLECGLRLFGQRSFVDVSIDDIAQAAGVSKGLMYHYFGSKRAFYTEVVRYAASKLAKAIAPDERRSGIENARHGLRAYFDFVAAHEDAYLALMLGGLGVDDLVQRILEETRQAIVLDILSGVGAAAPASAPLRAAVRSWLGAVEAAAVDWLAHRDVEVDILVKILSTSLFAQIVVAGRSAGTPIQFERASIEQFVAEVVSDSLLSQLSGKLAAGLRARITSARAKR